MVYPKPTRSERRTRKFRASAMARTPRAVARLIIDDPRLFIAGCVVFDGSSHRILHCDLSSDGVAVRTLPTFYSGFSSPCAARWYLGSTILSQSGDVPLDW